VLWIFERNWIPYYAAFPFATLNRETTALLIVTFALTQFGALRRVALARHLAAQVALWFAIKALLHVAFADNPGVGQYWAGALRNSWTALQDPANLATLATVFGFLWLPLAWFAREIREPSVRRAVLAVPLYCAACAAMAQVLELRVYGEALPLVVLGVACGVAGRLARRVPAVAVPPPAPV
jgi:hypothetical protein